MSADLSQISLLLLDVDGVLTDGSITYSDSGEQIKSFNSKDGLGIRLLMDAGINVGIITARVSKALEFRCKNLGITLIFSGIHNKIQALETIVEQTNTALENIAYVGDDLLDLPVIKRVGTSFCVADAAFEVKLHSDIVTCNNGGKGAVREISESILKAKHLWDNALDNFLS